MDDLISRAAATRAAVISVRDYLGNIDSERDIHIEEGLYEVPAVDAVPVVRCKDCRHRGSNAICVKLWVGTKDSFFCAFGERRESNETGRP